MTVQKLTEVGYVKINLALHVRGRLPNGYHQLETLFAFGNKGDVITAQLNDALSMGVSGSFAQGLSTGDDNLVLKAARALQAVTGTSLGAKLHLQKDLPVASGIGGGSADAAATLRILNRLWKLSFSDETLQDIARPLGADVPACIKSATCRGAGVGDVLEPIDGKTIQGLSLLLVNPSRPVSTAEVFEKWDRIDRGTLPATGSIIDIARIGRNDLTTAAVQFAPEIADIVAELSEHDPFLSRMSGSGATCFAIFSDDGQALAAEQAIDANWPNYWTMTCQIR